VLAQFKQVKPVSGSKATEVKIKFSHPIRSDTYVETELDVGAGGCNCAEPMGGGRGDGFGEATIRHSWVRFYGGQNTSSYYSWKATASLDTDGNPDGYAFVFSIYYPGTIHMGFIKVDLNGDVQRSMDIELPNGNYLTGADIVQALDSSGKPYAYYMGVAYMCTGTLDIDSGTAKTDLEGNVIWFFHHNDHSEDFSESVLHCTQIFNASGQPDGIAYVGSIWDTLDTSVGQPWGPIPHLLHPPNDYEGNAHIVLVPESGGTHSSMEYYGNDSVSNDNESLMAIAQSFDTSNVPDGYLVNGRLVYSYPCTFAKIDNSWNILWSVTYGTFEDGQSAYVPDLILTRDTSGVPDGAAIYGTHENFAYYQSKLFMAKVRLNDGGEIWYHEYQPLGFQWYNATNFQQTAVEYGGAVNGYLLGILFYDGNEITGYALTDLLGNSHTVRSILNYNLDDMPGYFNYRTTALQAFDKNKEADGYVLYSSPTVPQDRSQRLRVVKTDIYGNCYKEEFPISYDTRTPQS